MNKLFNTQVIALYLVLIGCGVNSDSDIVGNWSLCRIGNLCFNVCPIVILDNSEQGSIKYANLSSCDFSYAISGSTFNISNSSCNKSYLANGSYEFQLDVKNGNDFELILISKSDTFYLGRTSR